MRLFSYEKKKGSIFSFYDVAENVMESVSMSFSDLFLPLMENNAPTP